MAAELVAQHVPPGRTFNVPPELIAPKMGPPTFTGVTIPEDFAEALERLPMELAPCAEEPPVGSKITDPFLVSGTPPGEAMAPTTY